VRQTQTGASRTWLLRYRWRDEWVRIALGHVPEMSLAEARQCTLELRKVMGDGIDPRRARPRRRPTPPPLPASAAVSSPDSKHTVNFLVTEFVERHLRPHRKNAAYVERILARDVIPEWSGRDARTIKPREVVELLDKIVNRGSPVMANHVAGILSQLFRFGIHRAILETTPVQLLYRPGGKEKPRDRVLSDDELRAFLKDPVAATRFDRLSHVLTLLLLTGQRRGELILARWREIDFSARAWTIPDENSKTGRGHVVPLSDSAVKEFQYFRAAAGRSAWVLPASDPTQPLQAKLLTRGVAKCLSRFKRLGIAPFTLHDLRRTCRTGLARLRVEPHIAERVLNHAQERIPGTYDVHDYLEEKREALNRWAEHLTHLREM
jgi:integrase